MSKSRDGYNAVNALEDETEGKKGCFRSKSFQDESETRKLELAVETLRRQGIVVVEPNWETCYSFRCGFSEEYTVQMMELGITPQEFRASIARINQAGRTAQSNVVRAMSYILFPCVPTLYCVVQQADTRAWRAICAVLAQENETLYGPKGLKMKICGEGTKGSSPEIACLYIFPEHRETAPQSPDSRNNSPPSKPSHRRVSNGSPPVLITLAEDGPLDTGTDANQPRRLSNESGKLNDSTDTNANQPRRLSNESGKLPEPRRFSGDANQGLLANFSSRFSNTSYYRDREHSTGSDCEVPLLGAD